MAISFQRGSVDPKFHVEGVAPTDHSSSQKTRINVLSYGIKSGPIFLPFCQGSRVWQTDKQTDRQTEFSSLDRVCIPCSAVKNKRTVNLSGLLFSAVAPHIVNTFSRRDRVRLVVRVRIMVLVNRKNRVRFLVRVRGTGQLIHQNYFSG